ncbi:hypothetical protein G647_01511 [Cladophialophora carrionii CBS 160.54]|uniref:F-box domain-containing protein n=1 Tax=Cladophialophora carrionii CBS 160.54 TaxID=1279043 RepID=V9DRW9_9EURO|nr:uncharacterized protein G647_01511 [Cladophialophora carrionii CBS 160.54]ETI29058.1 hypothetical protein G647_01511 [Cladophialophora carrionii CBS 160.54]
MIYPGDHYFPLNHPQMIAGVTHKPPFIGYQARMDVWQRESAQPRSTPLPESVKQESYLHRCGVACSEISPPYLEHKRNSEEVSGCTPEWQDGQQVDVPTRESATAVHPAPTFDNASSMPFTQQSQRLNRTSLISVSSQSPSHPSLTGIPPGVIVGIWPCIASSSTRSSLRLFYQPEQVRPSTLYSFDGAHDEPDETQPATIGRSASASDLKVPSLRPLRPSVVHFLSDEHLNWREAARRKERDEFTNPFGVEDSPSRKTSSASEATIYLRPNAFAGHRDTLARLHYFARSDEDDQTATDSDDESYMTAWTRQPSVSAPSRRYSLAGANLDIFLPQQVVETVLSYLSFDDYKNLRSVCRQWHATLPPPNFPGAYRVPREVLKQIFSYLAPWDFDAARHTCKPWFLAGLDCKVLEPMLRGCGCQSALAADIGRMQGNIVAKRRSWDSQLGPMDPDANRVIDKEWLCSKRLATESRLSPYWRGDSLSEDLDASPRLSITETIDFSNILTAVSLPTNSRFTVSACGKFVLVVSGGDISVYSLSDQDHSLDPVVRLATGLDVLKVSMDTCSERYSVAALLAGRIGMLWDLRGRHMQKRYRSNSGEPMNLGMQTLVQSPATFQNLSSYAISLPVRSPEIVAIESSDSSLRSVTMPSTISPPDAMPNTPFL